MELHPVTFRPSGRSARVADGATLLQAASAAGEPLHAECAGRGACGRCLVRILDGQVPDYRVLRLESGSPQVLACLTPVYGPLTVQPLLDPELPKLDSRDKNSGLYPLEAWAPWPLDLRPIVESSGDDGLAVAVDIGTTTLRLLLLRLADGLIVGEADAYNPQIPQGADVISRIVAAEKGGLRDLAASIRRAVSAMALEAAAAAGRDPGAICGYMAAGNVTMMHLLFGCDPSGIRRVPSEPSALSFPPEEARRLGWPGRDSAPVFSMPAAGSWVGGDILAGAVRAGFSRAPEGLGLYVDLGTNGEIVLGGADYALACACSAGPAFEGGGIRCGMRADRGAVDGASIDVPAGRLDLSVIGGGRVRGICGSGLIALADALFRAGWIDRGGRFTERMPAARRVEGAAGVAIALSEDRRVALWERDLGSLIRSKAAVLAGIRSLYAALGSDVHPVGRAVVSGNLGRFLNLPAALSIGLLPSLPLGCYDYVENGSLEGAALGLLAHDFHSEVGRYLRRVTYVDLAELPGYMDEFVAASFLPHTSPELLHLQT